MTEKWTRSSRKPGIRLDAPAPIIQILHHHPAPEHLNSNDMKGIDAMRAAFETSGHQCQLFLEDGDELKKGEEG